MTKSIKLQYVTLSEPCAVLTFDPVALFIPMPEREWRASLPSREAWREALGCPGRVRATHIELDLNGPPVDLVTDCIGRTVLKLSSAAIIQMFLGSGHVKLWGEALSRHARYGWQPLHMRRWLRKFLRTSDARVIETMLRDAYGRALASTE
jgi:hypothetical protein